MLILVIFRSVISGLSDSKEVNSPIDQLALDSYDHDDWWLMIDDWWLMMNDDDDDDDDELKLI